jgi:arylsulfatase A-like enzyme
MTRGGRPAFVFTQSQDVHLANVAIDARARFARGEDAFYQPYAARIRTMDACFGTFIRFLKDNGLYDNSVVIVTSDHGDSLGDEGRWGHAYTVFPEVIAVPLIVRVPPRASESLAVDTDALAFTTDIAPTLYRLLGRAPAELGPMFGMPLVGATPAALTARRREPYIVASSYGPVYGLLEKNGDELYIIDAVNTAEHKYDLRRGLNGERVVVTDIDRQRSIDAIQTQVLEVSKFYGVKPTR